MEENNQRHLIDYPDQSLTENEPNILKRRAVAENKFGQIELPSAPQNYQGVQCQESRTQQEWTQENLSNMNLPNQSQQIRISRDQNALQNTEMVEQVMQLPPLDFTELKVIESKTICYCSNFDLNINEWFNEYENIEIFKLNMRKNLGESWFQFAQNAIESSVNVSKQRQREEHFFTLMFNFYLLNYYSTVHTTKLNKDSNSEMVKEQFCLGALGYLKDKNYCVKDQNVFKQLILTFSYVSHNEYTNIIKKIESDEKYQIHLTEKALAQYDQFQRQEELQERERYLDEQRQKNDRTFQKPEPKVDQEEKYLGRYFPGFSIIKDKVIKPLLVATEKVVEYYFPEKEEDEQKQKEPLTLSGKGSGQINLRSSAGAITQTSTNESQSSEEISDFNKIKKRFKKLGLNSVDDVMSQRTHQDSPKSHTTLKKRRYRQLERHNIDEIFDPFLSSNDTQIGPGSKSKNDRKSLKLNEKILKKASATVDLISQKIKSRNLIQETITASFVTNVIELTPEALKTIQKQDGILFNQEIQNKDTIKESEIFSNMNLRFIKPSHTFYNKVMSLWFKFLNLQKEEEMTQSRLPLQAKDLKISFIQFFLNQQILQTQGQPQPAEYKFLKPLEAFSNIICEQHIHLRSLNGWSSDEQISMCTFFDNVKTSLFLLWEKEIIQKSGQFQQIQSQV